jgi:hypothetical protein
VVRILRFTTLIIWSSGDTFDQISHVSSVIFHADALRCSFSIDDAAFLCFRLEMRSCRQVHGLPSRQAYVFISSATQDVTWSRRYAAVADSTA